MMPPVTWRVCMHQCLPFVVFPPRPFLSPISPFLAFHFFPRSLFPVCPLCVSVGLLIFAFYYLLPILLCFVVLFFVFRPLLRTWYGVCTVDNAMPYAILVNVTGTTYTFYEREKIRARKENTPENTQILAFSERGC